MRVHELAAELNTNSAEIIRVANDHGIDVSAAAAGLTDEQADQIRVFVQLFGNEGDGGSAADGTGDDATNTGEQVGDDQAAAASTDEQSSNSVDQPGADVQADDVQTDGVQTDGVQAGDVQQGDVQQGGEPGERSPATDPVTEPNQADSEGETPTDPADTEPADGDAPDAETAATPAKPKRPKPTLPTRESSGLPFAARFPIVTHRKPDMNFKRPHTTETVTAAKDVAESQSLDKTGKPAVCVFNAGETPLPLQIHGGPDTDGEFGFVGEIEVPAGAALHVEDGVATACPFLRFVAGEPTEVTVSCLG